MFNNKSKIIISIIIAINFLSYSAIVEVPKITVAYQNGLTYLPLMVMEKHKLFEKHAIEKGLKDINANYIIMGGPGSINDALISGNAEFGAVGSTSLALLWERTKTNIKVKAVGSLAYMPLYLNTNNPNIKSIKDFTEQDKIALPTAKISIQAVTLQMAAAKLFGKDKFDILDKYTVSMSHPDAMIALINSKSGISGHFTAPPFQYFEIKKSNGKIRPILNSYKVLGGPVSLTLVVGNGKFIAQNPKIYSAFVAAFNEATKWINENKEAAALLYIDCTKSKENVNDISAYLSDPEIHFDLCPKGTLQYAKFMHEIGVLKDKPLDWKELVFPNLYKCNGN